MKRVALFVGVDEYRDGNIRNLNYARADARALATEFRTLLKFEPVVTLENPGNELEILDRVSELKAGLGEGDLFFFFFSGHGVRRKEDDVYRLVCADHRLKYLNLGYGGLDIKLLKKELMGGWNRMLVIDACQNDPQRTKAAGVGATKKDLALILAEEPGGGEQVVITSCSEGETALEVEREEHGLFTKALLDMLEAHVRDCKHLDVEVIRTELVHRMRSLAEKNSLVGVQKPKIDAPIPCGIVLLEGTMVSSGAVSNVSAATAPSPSLSDATAELFLLRREIEEALRKIGRNGQPPEEEELLAKAKYRFDAGNDAFEQKQYPPAVELFKQAKELLKERRAAIEARRKAEEDAKRAAVAVAKAAAAAKKAAEEKAAREAAQLKAAQERAEKEAREKAAQKAAREKAAKELAEKKAAEAKAAREKAEREKAEREAKAAAARAAAGLEEGKVAGATTTIALGHGEEMLMVWCPKGTFEMGSPSEEQRRDVDEELHPVTLTRGFWMSKYPVTQRQWKAVMGTNPSVYEGDSKPVENVTWEECREFCRRAGKGLRLPTEAEWEYACRAGSKGEYSGSGLLENMGWYASNTGGNESMFVGRKNPNAWGLNDMHGNVWEWCADAYDKQYGDDGTWHATDPTGGTDTSRRVIRGGAGGAKRINAAALTG